MSDDHPIIGGPAGVLARERAESLLGTTVLDRYRIEELVAMGGIASVFRAVEIATEKDVAIKILHPEAEGLPEMIQRFEREAIAGKHIFHENVAAVHLIDKLDDGSFFLVQEFVQGRTLRALINEGPIEALRAARIARQLAAALNAAHDLGIIHRDLKPLNVMILDVSPHPGLRPDKPGYAPDPAEHVLLIDFGLAKVPVEGFAIAGEDGRASLTQAGVLFGTIAYMAPEAALGMRVIDRRADLYALGLILYEMLAGKHPFTATEPKELFRQQRNDVPPRIADRTPGVKVPRVLETVVRKLLEKDPDVRYPHARSLMIDLDAAIREMEGATEGALEAPSKRVWSHRSRAMIAGAGAVIVALGLLVGWLFVR